MNIKVCGITQMKQLQQLDGLNIDFAGFIFHKDSPRYVGDKISKDEMQSADFDVKKIGVFVNAGYDEIMETVEDYGLDIVQLHGDETPELCEQLMEDVEVIKAFSIGNDDVSIDEMIEDYDEVCDYYLFDTKANGSIGGTGTKFDWKKIAKSKIEKPFFLSGGISVEDIAQIKAFKHPDYFGIDVNSRFEKSPGVKDMGLLLQLKQGLKSK
ncbi:MAG TPA: phosphoribosylanthranilate isomerase [Ferruginibacter sp.]|jgi:phosphoribosylanthranilate isomerase|nr:phosphoribosylanthranilate isomerase [Ferruginibacter sp.]